MAGAGDAPGSRGEPGEKGRGLWKEVVVVGTLLLAVLPPPAGAQGVGREAVSFGVKGSLSVVSMSGPDEPDPDLTRLDTGWRARLAAGGFVCLPVAKDVAVQVEALYVQKGGRFEGSIVDADASMEATFKVGYVEVPLLAKYTPGRAGGVRPYFFAGPTLGLRVGEASVHTEITSEETSLSYEDDDDLDEEFERSEIGVPAGGGVEMGMFLLEARYTAGLTAIAKGDDGVRTRTFLVLAGLRF